MSPGEGLPDPDFDSTMNAVPSPSTVEIAKRLAIIQTALIVDLKEVHLVVGEMIRRLSNGEDSAADMELWFDTIWDGLIQASEKNYAAQAIVTCAGSA